MKISTRGKSVYHTYIHAYTGTGVTSKTYRIDSKEWAIGNSGLEDWVKVADCQTAVGAQAGLPTAAIKTMAKQSTRVRICTTDPVECITSKPFSDVMINKVRASGDNVNINFNANNENKWFGFDAASFTASTPFKFQPTSSTCGSNGQGENNLEMFINQVPGASPSTSHPTPPPHCLPAFPHPRLPTSPPPHLL